MMKFYQLSHQRLRLQCKDRYRRYEAVCFAFLVVLKAKFLIRILRQQRKEEKVVLLLEMTQRVWSILIESGKVQH